MSKHAAAEALHFLSEVGHEPTFFIPDTGSPGVISATLTGPGGKVNVPEDQRSPGHKARTVEGKEGKLPAIGPRVGFKLPKFTEPGEYIFVVDQDDNVTTYVITVPGITRKGEELTRLDWFNKYARTQEG
jgi:hypothetical protein